MLLIIDGNSLLNRAFYALKSNLTAPDGTPTGALHGFFTMILSVRKELDPRVSVIAWDLRAPTFRHKLYAEYKGTRKPMSDELALQLPIAKELACMMGFCCVELEGYEADDILGTLAKKANAAGEEAVIATGDRDSLQLVSENTSVRLATNTGHVMYTPQEVFDKYGMIPDRLIDLKALMGDSSDNIPGVPGVGEKTAQILLSQGENLDDVYGKLEDLTVSAGVKEKLRKGRELAYISKELGTIFCEAPVEIPQPCELNDKVFSRLEELKLKSVLKLLGTPAETLAEEFLSLASIEEEEPKSLNSEFIEKLEADLEPVLREMEVAGFLIDRDALNEFGEKLLCQIKNLTEAITIYAGEEFNPNSPLQTGKLLFETLSLPHGKKTKTGYSTNVEVLKKIEDMHPIVPLLLEYRKLSKLYSTFVQGIEKAIQLDGRVHTTFTSTDTATGRIASKNPNLQNIPIREEIGREMRNFFVAPSGSVLVGADYSQIELRVLASISGDANMIKAFSDGEDIHSATAKSVFGTDEGDFRRRAKAINFGIVYGMGAFSLAKDIGVSTNEAKMYIEGYKALYFGIAKYMNKVVQDAELNGYVETVFGRRRAIPELASKNHMQREFGKRAALNSPIQGTAADIIKTAMVNVRNRLLAECPEAKLILQVHDELILECPKAVSAKAGAILKEEMENAAKLSVPLVADVKVGDCWGECH